MPGITSPEHHARALSSLDKARRHRADRRRIRRSLRESTPRHAREACARLLLDPPETIASMRVDQLLLLCHGFGRYQVDRLLHRHQIRGLRTVGQLQFRQAMAMAGDLRHGYHDEPELSVRRLAS